jgi:hypothetical protein
MDSRIRGNDACLPHVLHPDRQGADVLSGCMEYRVGDGGGNPDHPDFADRLAAQPRPGDSMKLLAPLLLAVTFAFAPAVQAQKAPPSIQQVPATPGPATKRAEPNEAYLDTQKHYINSRGETVHSPAKSKDGQAPAGASAQCRDGTYSFSRSRRGTCSGHGGVASWM